MVVALAKWNMLWNPQRHIAMAGIISSTLTVSWTGCHGGWWNGWQVQNGGNSSRFNIKANLFGEWYTPENHSPLGKTEVLSPMSLRGPWPKGKIDLSQETDNPAMLKHSLWPLELPRNSGVPNNPEQVLKTERKREREREIDKQTVLPADRS